MCTVSVVPRDDGFRLVCNRDELLSRPTAVPPVWTTTAHVVAAYPIDPQAGGTWIAVNEHGLAVTLLNRRTRGDGVRGVPSAESVPNIRRSRGEIPLALVGARTLQAVRRALDRLDPAAYAGFRVVVVRPGRLLIATSDGARMGVETRRLRVPIAFTSSSRGDAEAARVRMPLFRRLVLDRHDPLAGQQAFHDHRWPACPELSVRMRRHDARTVSRTMVDVEGGRVSLAYAPLPQDA